MFATRFVLAALALANVALAGAPPACLLGAVQGLPNPADMSAVCNKYQTAVVGNLTEMCSGDDAKSAFSAYSATCSLNGVQVKALATSSADASSSSASATATGKATATTGTHTSTATAKASASTKTGTSTASATGSSASETGVTTSGASTASQPVTFVVSALLALGVANLLLL